MLSTRGSANLTPRSRQRHLHLPARVPGPNRRPPDGSDEIEPASRFRQISSRASTLSGLSSKVGLCACPQWIWYRAADPARETQVWAPWLTLDLHWRPARHLATETGETYGPSRFGANRSQPERQALGTPGRSAPLPTTSTPRSGPQGNTSYSMQAVPHGASGYSPTLRQRRYGPPSGSPDGTE